MHTQNQVVITGKIHELAPPRYTPAGIRIVEFKLHHQSSQIEAGVQRRVVCELLAIAMEGIAIKIADMGCDNYVKLTGFLSMKSRMSKQLVLHVCDVESAKEYLID